MTIQGFKCPYSIYIYVTYKITIGALASVIFFDVKFGVQVCVHIITEQAILLSIIFAHWVSFYPRGPVEYNNRSAAVTAMLIWRQALVHGLPYSVIHFSNPSIIWMSDVKKIQ